jgi:hypothetical protein
MTMYKFLRNTHLLIGLFCFLFLLMYGVSAVQMAHNRWFNNKPVVTEAGYKLDAGAADARIVARQLMDRYDVKGELAQVRKSGDGFDFRIQRPGTVYEVSYATDSGAATVKTNTANFMGMLNRIHHVGGLWHEFSLTNVWSVFVGLVSLGLILLALTGIYLWFKIHSERLVGGILLGVSLGYSVTLMVLIRTAY